MGFISFFWALIYWVDLGSSPESDALLLKMQYLYAWPKIKKDKFKKERKGKKQKKKSLRLAY